MTEQDDVTATTERIVHHMLKAISDGDGASLAACLHDELVFTMPGLTEIHGTFEGVDAFNAISADVMSHLSTPIALTVNNVIVAGEWATVEATGTATTNSGEPYNNHYCFVWRILDGLVVEMKEYHDTDLVRRVLLTE